MSPHLPDPPTLWTWLPITAREPPSWGPPLQHGLCTQPLPGPQSRLHGPLDLHQAASLRPTEPTVLAVPSTWSTCPASSQAEPPQWGALGRLSGCSPPPRSDPDRLFECLSFAPQMRFLTPRKREGPAVPPGPWAFFPARAPPAPDVPSPKPRASLPRPRAALGTSGRVLSGFCPNTDECGMLSVDPASAARCLCDLGQMSSPL